LSRFSRAGTLYTLKKLNELENYGIDWHSYSDKYLSSLGKYKDDLGLDLLRLPTYK